jgi:hypothetical protein
MMLKEITKTLLINKFAKEMEASLNYPSSLKNKEYIVKGGLSLEWFFMSLKDQFRA